MLDDGPSRGFRQGPDAPGALGVVAARRVDGLAVAEAASATRSIRTRPRYSGAVAQSAYAGHVVKPNRSIPQATVIPVLEYGKRQYTTENPTEHQRTFSETLADVARGEWDGASVAPH